MQKIHFLEKKNRYTFILQYTALRAHFKQSHGKLLHNGFVWYCALTPSPISDIYQIRIEYKAFELPQIYVVSPKPLALAIGATRLPHTYDTKTQRLCLFHPQKNEWNSTKPIATTIVHWAVLWLKYYETWRLTGKWYGGGHGNWDIQPQG